MSPKTWLDWVLIYKVANIAAELPESLLDWQARVHPRLVAWVNENVNDSD